MASGEQCWGARMGTKGRGKVLDDTSKAKRTRCYVIREDWSVIHAGMETDRYNTYISKIVPPH